MGNENLKSAFLLMMIINTPNERIIDFSFKILTLFILMNKILRDFNMQWIYITFRITSFHAYTELNIRQKPIILLILWLSVFKKQSNVVSLMKTILCVCQLQIANMVAIKFNHPLWWNVQLWLAEQFVFWMQETGMNLFL